MRTLQVTAYELEVGQQVLVLGEREFNAPVVVTKIRWVKDSPLITFAMEGGEVAIHLDPDLLVSVIHSDQDPIYEYDERFEIED